MRTAPIFALLSLTVVISTVSCGPSGPGWQDPEFDDSSWRYGPAAFGTPDQRNVNVRFQTPDIWVRRDIRFDPDRISGRRLFLKFSHDDVFRLYVNGIQVVDKGFEWANDVECEIPDSVVWTMAGGKAVIAAHCHNRYGGAMVDFGPDFDIQKSH